MVDDIKPLPNLEVTKDQMLACYMLMQVWGADKMLALPQYNKVDKALFRFGEKLAHLRSKYEVYGHTEMGQTSPELEAKFFDELHHLTAKYRAHIFTEMLGLLATEDNIKEIMQRYSKSENRTNS